MFNMIPLVVAALCALAVSARADCDACVNGWCHTRKSLLAGSHFTNLLALDHTHNVLYVQLTFNAGGAFYKDGFKIISVPRLLTYGITFDQDTYDLFVNYNKTIVKMSYDGNTPQVYAIDEDVDLIYCAKNVLFYTHNLHKGVHFIDENRNNSNFTLSGTDNIDNITNFVLNSNHDLYYVTDKKVYTLKKTSASHKLVSDKGDVIALDKSNRVHIGDANEKVIYILNESDEPVQYAAYKTGSVDKFVLDRDNNIVFHDAVDDTIATWEKGLNRCMIEPNHQFNVLGPRPL